MTFHTAKVSNHTSHVWKASPKLGGMTCEKCGALNMTRQSTFPCKGAKRAT